MRDLILSVVIAIAVDTAIGDPRWKLHPVRLIGMCAAFFERVFSKAIRREVLAGILVWIYTIACVAAPAILLLWLARAAGSVFSIAVSSFYLYFCIAPRDLAKHASAARREIQSGTIAGARKRTSYLVSRDVSQLDRSGLTRAVIESTAENVVDGVTAPLIYFAVFGPVGAVFYRVVNTLDAMFGYKNKRYLRFGRVSAKADDVLGWLPARMTGPIYCISAVLADGSMFGAFKVMLRDHRKHESPNAGIVESAAAGALGIQLGGVGVYSGVVIEKPLLGEPCRAPEPRDITRLIVMMYATTLIVAVAALFAAYFRLKITAGWL